MLGADGLLQSSARGGQRLLIVSGVTGEFHTYVDNSKPQREYSKGNVTAKIFDVVGVLSSSTIRGVKWCKQVSIVDWGHGPKYDFRKWTGDYDKCSKGICLSQEEVDELITLLKSI